MKRFTLSLIVTFAVVGCKSKDKAKDKESDKPAAKVDAGGAAKAAIDAAAGAPAGGDDGGADPVPVAKPGETFQLGNVMPDQWFAKDGGCAKVLQRIAECAKDKAFLDALNADAEPDDAKIQADRAAGFAKTWGADPQKSCDQLPSVSYEDEGFLSTRWDDLAAASADCAKLGTAVSDGFGLPGGSTDE